MAKSIRRVETTIARAVIGRTEFLAAVALLAIAGIVSNAGFFSFFFLFFFFFYYNSFHFPSPPVIPRL